MNPLRFEDRYRSAGRSTHWLDQHLLLALGADDTNAGRDFDGICDRKIWIYLNNPEYILNEISTSEQCCIMFYHDVLCISFNIQDVNLTKGFDSRSSSQKGENYQGCPEADVEEFDDLADGAILAVPWHDHRTETGRLRRTKLIQKAQKRTWKNQVLQECRNPYFGHWKKDQSMDLFVAAKVIRLMPLHRDGNLNSGCTELPLQWSPTRECCLLPPIAIAQSPINWQRTWLSLALWSSPWHPLARTSCSSMLLTWTPQIVQQAASDGFKPEQENEW